MTITRRPRILCIGAIWIGVGAIIPLLTGITAAEPSTPPAEKSPSTVSPVKEAKPANAVDPATLAYELVEQLGDKKFAVRKTAHKRLLELGPVALEAVEAGLLDTSPERRMRCKQICSLLRYKKRQNQIEEFARDTTGKKGTSLPTWEHFRAPLRRLPRRKRTRRQNKKRKTQRGKPKKWAEERGNRETIRRKGS